MSLRRDLRHGRRIARGEFVRSVRGYVRNKRRLAGLAVAVLFFGSNFVVALPTAYALGLSARSIDAIPYFAPVATAVPPLLVALATLRTLERIGRIDAASLVLTVVHPRAVVVGLVGAELARLALWFGAPLAAVAAAFALGLGAPSLPLSAAAVGLPLLCWTAVWGYAVGMMLLWLFRRLPSVRRVLKVGGLLAMAAVVVASQFASQYLVTEGTSIGEFVVVAPVVDYVALAFVGTPLARPASSGAVLVLVGLLGLTPVGLAVATRQASRLWFADEPARAAPPRPTTSSGWLAAPPPFAWRTAGRVAWAVLVRARRHPQELAHLVMILFFLGPLGTTVASSDALGPLVAAAGVGFGVYLAGATFGLNPLGDDRPQLPVLLLTATDTRTLVRGRSLAGLAVGVPVVVAVPLTSILVGTRPVHAVGFAVVGCLMCLPAASVALGLGAAYPVYEEREFWGTETVVPSTLVMMGYSFVVGGGTVIGLLVTWYVLTGHLTLNPLPLAALGVYLALTVGVSYGSYRYALRRYRRYTFD
jgi:ABC-2 type transport system permease protein